VDNITTLNRRIERIDLRPADKKVLLSYRDYHPPSYSSEEEKNPKPRSKNLTTTTAYDYAIITPPFTIVRKWRLPHTLPTTITNAINKLQYGTACKVALEFSSRFWEAYPDQPIYGGCSTTTDIPGIGQICYPSYNINGSSTGGGGPATLLASYSADFAWGTGWLSATDEEHVDYVLEAMVEIHGEAIRALYTGKWRRKCWMLDPLASAGWASPVVGQHQLYIPEYFRTHDGVRFLFSSFLVFSSFILPLPFCFSPDSVRIEGSIKC
jgi:monoamine oxidase